MHAAVLRDDLVDAGLLLEDQHEEPCPSHLGDLQHGTASEPPKKLDRGPLLPLHNETLAGDARRTAKQKSHSHRNRSAKRQAAREAQAKPYTARAKVTKKYVTPVDAVETDWKAEDARVASTAYIGLRNKSEDKHLYSLDELVGPSSKFNFRLLRYRKGTPIPIVSADKNKYIIAVVADAPNDPNWDKVAADAASYLEDARYRCQIPDDETVHRRGVFSTLRSGVSYGGGQTKPSNVANRDREAEVVRELNSKEPFIRISGFATSVLAAWSPKVYTHYVDNLRALRTQYPHLQPSFERSAFAATTYNLGPRTACHRHHDFLNLPFGWCAITALGNYDYTKGGHIVLWEARLVIEFPPGTTILIPSAVISHSNVAISSGERRYSFTEYSAGGLFRWVANGFKTSAAFWDSLNDDARKFEKERAKNRWKEGLAMWTKLDDLVAYAPPAEGV